MPTRTDNPLVVQSDHTLLLEVDHALAETCRQAILPFTDLLKSPDHVHTYRITPFTLWNASASGFQAEEVLKRLARFSRYPLPLNLVHEIETQMGRYGQVELLPGPTPAQIVLSVPDQRSAIDVFQNPRLVKFMEASVNGDPFRRRISSALRGEIKVALTEIGYPARDLVGFEDGEKLSFELLDVTRSGQPFTIRGYQSASIDAFYQDGRPEGGQGVVVLPCGAGKTIVGLGSDGESGIEDADPGDEHRRGEAVGSRDPGAHHA